MDEPYTLKHLVSEGRMHARDRGGRGEFREPPLLDELAKAHFAILEDELEDELECEQFDGGLDHTLDGHRNGNGKSKTETDKSAELSAKRL